MNGKIVGFAFAAIIAVNAILALIIMPFNLSINNMLEQTLTQDNTSTVLYKTPDTVEKSKTTTVLAETILNDLILKVAPPEGWTAQEKVADTPLSTVIDLRCPTPAATVSPAFSRNLSYSNGNPSNGISVQVNAYPAGQGAKATEEILTRVDKCSKISATSRNLGYATESFSIDDNGSREESGGEGRTTVFRVGDVVAVVAVRGVDKNIADTVAKNWYTQWAPILTTEICPQQLSTATDATRSPFNAEYKEGWLHRETVTLDDSRSLVADIVGRIILLQTIPQGQSSVAESKTIVPYEALNTSPILEMVKYPETVKIVLPENKPIKPGIPVFPKAPTTYTTEPIVLNDETGPGCGWAFTGQTSPTLDTTKTKANQVTDVRIAAADKLMEAKSKWWSEKYKYGKAYKEYAVQAEIYNNWMKEANKAISKAWWDAYTQSLIGYQDKVIAYIEEYSKWKSVNPNCTAPQNTVSVRSSTATPAPVATLEPGCPTPPKAPVRPAEPTIPKPELMPSGSIPAAPANIVDSVN